MLDERKDRGIDMFAASTYEEIERIERQVENMEIVVFLFARPTEEKILKEFEYIHYNSARYCSIYVQRRECFLEHMSVEMLRR